MSIKGAIFDFDGTIYDSLDFWETVSSDFIKKKYNIIDLDVDSECETLTIKEALEYISKKHSVEIDGTDLYKYFYEYYTKLNINKNVLKIIENYKKNNIKMIIATVTEKPLVIESLKNLGLTDHFIDIVTVGEVKKSKEHPDIYNICLEKLNLKKDEVLVYEDSKYAIKTLLDNDFNCIGIQGRDDLTIFKGLEVISK